MSTLVRPPVEVAADVLGSMADRDVPLGPLTTYRVGGAAALYATPRTVVDLRRIALARRASDLPVLVVGKGSNLLVADAGFHGIAVTLAEMAADIDLPAHHRSQGAAGGEPGELVVGAGGAVSLPVLARRTAAAGITGFEWAVGIPGSIGGAVAMNAGGHGSDMDAVMIDATIVSLDADDAGASEPVVIARPQLGLRFRGSDVGPLDVVLGVRLALAPGDAGAAAARVSEIVRWRRENQPGGQNCGSVFINPVPGEVSAGQLIDGLGLRGFRIGSAEVSVKHANFIQADDGGRAGDVREVMEAVRARVANGAGYRLRSEVRLIGFDE